MKNITQEQLGLEIDKAIMKARDQGIEYAKEESAHTAMGGVLALGDDDGPFKPEHLEGVFKDSNLTWTIDRPVANIYDIQIRQGNKLIARYEESILFRALENLKDHGVWESSK